MSSIADNEELSIAELTRRVKSFALERDWPQFHDPKNLVMALASEVGELAAVLRWVPNCEADEVAMTGGRRDQLRAEIGDVAICLLLLCDRANIALGPAVIDKLATNAKKYPASSSRGCAEATEPQ